MSKEEVLKVIKESTLSVLSQLLEAEDLSNNTSEKANENIDTISEIIFNIEVAIGDGLQWADLSVIGKLVPSLMTLASDFENVEGEQKKEFVVDLIWATYRVIDTFPDGERNNVDVPWVSGGLERKTEKAIITFAANMAVDAAFRSLRKLEEV